MALRLQSGETVGYKVFDYMVAVVFVADMAINFRTTFVVTRTGDEIWDQKMIAKRYLFGGRFIIDFLSAFPLEELGVTYSCGLLAYRMMKTAALTSLRCSACLRSCVCFGSHALSRT